MSDTSVDKVVTVEDKIKMLTDWIGLIQSDIDLMQSERDAEYAVYKKQKDMYDSWLAKRYKKVTRVEKRINDAKKNIDIIHKEIDAIRNRPPPGVLPPLEETPKQVQPKRWFDKPTVATVVPTKEETDLSNVDFELSPEERASLNKQATQ